MTDDTRDIAPVETIPGRKEVRYPADTPARIEAIELRLKDLSLAGGRIQSREFLDIVPNGSYTIVIAPEAEAHLEEFEVEIVSRWMRIKRTGFETGFVIVVPPGSTAVERYIEFLKTQHEL
jgi:hypothetical protein